MSISSIFFVCLVLYWRLSSTILAYVCSGAAAECGVMHGRGNTAVVYSRRTNALFYPETRGSKKLSADFFLCWLFFLMFQQAIGCFVHVHNEKRERDFCFSWPRHDKADMLMADAPGHTDNSSTAARAVTTTVVILRVMLSSTRTPQRAFFSLSFLRLSWVYVVRVVICSRLEYTSSATCYIHTRTYLTKHTPYIFCSRVFFFSSFSADDVACVDSVCRCVRHGGDGGMGSSTRVWPRSLLGQQDTAGCRGLRTSRERTSSFFFLIFWW